MTEVDDGWVEVPGVHDPIVRTRFDKKNTSPDERDQRARVELQRPNISGAPLASPLFPVSRLQQDLRSCLTPLNDPLELPSSKGGLSTDVQRPSVTLNSHRLHWLRIVNTPLNFLRRVARTNERKFDKSNLTGAGAFRQVRLQFRVEMDLKREVCDRGAKCLRSLLSWARCGSGAIGWKTAVRHSQVCNAGVGGEVVNRWTKRVRERPTMESAAGGIGSFEHSGLRY